MTLTVARCASCGAHIIGGATLCLTCEAALSDDSARDTTIERLRAVTLGDYVLVRELGRGRMTIAYLARDTELDRDVVVKVVRPEHAEHRALLHRFWQAASKAASLGAHPNVLRVYRAPERRGVRFLAMQYVDGCSLDRLLRDAAPLPLGVAWHVIAQIALALRHAHERGVVHGDVEPGNVMIDRDGTVVVTDFGIAEVANRFAVGRAPYASPEQLRGATPTPASDQYALGAVAYRLIAGTPPFAGTTAELRRAHVDDTPPTALRDVRPDCPPALAAVVERMLEPVPGDRWPDVAAVCVALSDLARDDDEDAGAKLGALVAATMPWTDAEVHGLTTTERAATTHDVPTHDVRTHDVRTHDVRAHDVRVIASRIPRRWGRRRALAAAGLAGLVLVGVMGAATLRIGNDSAVSPARAPRPVATAPSARPVARPAARPTAPPPAPVAHSAVVPKAVVPTPVASKVIAPKVIAPKVIAPKTVAPKAVVPKPVVPTSVATAERVAPPVAARPVDVPRVAKSKVAKSHVAKTRVAAGHTPKKHVATTRRREARVAVRRHTPAPLTRMERAGDVARAADAPDPVATTMPSAPSAPSGSGEASEVAARRAAARGAIESFVADLEAGRTDALARRLVADEGADVGAFLTWLRGVRHVEVSPVIIGPPVISGPAEAASAFRVWVHWHTPAGRTSVRRTAEVPFRLVLTRDGGAWRPGDVRLLPPNR